MKTIIRFEESAPVESRTDDYFSAFVSALKARPKVWALLGTYSTSGSGRQAAYAIRRGLFARFAGGGFESEARTLFGEHRVYVRYVGGEVR